MSFWENFIAYFTYLLPYLSPKPLNISSRLRNDVYRYLARTLQLLTDRPNNHSRHGSLEHFCTMLLIYDLKQ